MATVGDVLLAVRRTRPRQLLRTLARTPLEFEAAEMLRSLPTVELASLTGPLSFTATISALDRRHDWSLGALEQLVLQALIQARGIRSAFEIGTFNGGTTRVIAEALPDDGRIVTLDLPSDAFDASQAPKGFRGADVGRAYESSTSKHKVTQLLGNSLEFDVTPYRGQFDLVLVDGGHEYVHGVADTRTALELIAPGGLVLWDDFAPYWHGLVRGICQEMQSKSLARLAGTSLGVYVAPPATA